MDDSKERRQKGPAEGAGMNIEAVENPARCLSCREPLDAIVQITETEDAPIVAHVTCKNCGAWARVCAPNAGYKIKQAALAALSGG